MKNTSKKMKRISKLFGIIAVTAVIVSIPAGCVSYSVQSVTISTDNNATQIKAGETLQFNFNVEAYGKDTSKSQVVKWSVSSTPDGRGPVISGTGVNSGGLLTVSADEIYPVIYVTASHAVFSSQKDQRQIQVSGPKVGSVILSTTAPSVVAGKTVKLSAFVAGLPPNQGLTYSVGSKDDGTGAVTAGTAMAADGTLTVAAGEKSSSVFVRAVSNSDKTKFDVKEIKVITVTSVTVTADGGSARVLRGDKLKFSAAVTGTNNPGTGVTWKVALKNDGTGNVTAGTAITSDGTLTVASTEAAATLYVIATSSVDNTKSGSIAVIIPTVTSVTVTPANPQIKRGDGATFRARVAGTGDPGQNVTWKMDGVGGTTTATTITSNGTLVVSTAETLSQLIVTATSVDDPSKSGTTIITIPAVPAAIVPATPAAPAAQAAAPSATAPAASASVATTSNAAAEADFDTKTVSNTIEIIKYKGSATTVTIPATIRNLPVTVIGEKVFQNNTKLTSVTIPNSVTKIGQYAFYGCTSLPGITIPNSVKSIEWAAFAGCSGFTSITIPSSVTKIAMTAFSGCIGLTSVTIPSSVTDIDATAFSRCTNLTAINVDAANTKYTSDSGVLYNKSKTTLVTYPAGKKGAFTVPSSVTKIEYGAFLECTGLTSLTIPDSVTGSVSFSGSSNLTSLNIGKGVTAFSDFAFSGCSSLTNITIPDSIIQTGTDFAYDAKSPPTYRIPWFNNQPDGVVYVGKVASKYKGTMPANTSITLRNGTKTIAKYAFLDCTGLTSITIPDSVNRIEESAFSGCSNLTSITFQGTIPASIGYNERGLQGLAYEGDLYEKFYATDKDKGTPGTYTRPDGKSRTWTKQ